MTDLTTQDLPDEACCPDCGAEPDTKSITEHRLGNLGYLHDDRPLECENGHEWQLGIPVGSYDGADDLVCGSCDTIMTVHRVEIPRRSAKVYAERRNNPTLTLHLKCPTCYHFKRTTRWADNSGVALVGDPRTTGSLDGADSMGYPADHAGPGDNTIVPTTTEDDGDDEDENGAENGDDGDDVDDEPEPEADGDGDTADDTETADGGDDGGEEP